MDGEQLFSASSIFLWRNDNESAAFTRRNRFVSVSLALYDDIYFAMTTDQLTTDYIFCTKCGAKNSLEANYCLKCGSALENEEETRIASARKPVLIETEDNEREIFSISPTLLFVKIGYGLAAIGGLFLVALLGMLYNALRIPTWVAILFALSLLLIPAFYHLRQKMFRYTLTDAKIEIDSGLISKQTRNIPLRTIQDVTVSATVPQRMLGFGNLIIENASEADGKIILKNINSPKKYADVLLKQMRKLNK